MDTSTHTLPASPASFASSPASVPVAADDVVARRIVMRRSTWDQLAHLAEVLREVRDIEVEPTEVALIALEAGLEEVERGLSGKQKRPASASGAAKRAAGAPAPTESGRQRRRSGGPRLDADERSELEALLADVRSVRARQRTIALWLGLRRRRVPLEWLRQLTAEYGAYDVANFAQNMKKDRAFFLEARSPEGKRTGWRLSRAGSREAKALLAELLAVV